MSYQPPQDPGYPQGPHHAQDPDQRWQQPQQATPQYSGEQQNGYPPPNSPPYMGQSAYPQTPAPHYQQHAQYQPVNAPVPPYMVARAPGGQSPKTKRKALPFVLGGIGAVLLLCVAGTAIGAAADDNTQAGGPASANVDASAVPVKDTAVKPSAAATVKPTATTVKPVPTAKPASSTNSSYEKLTDRSWLQIIKDPDGHAGEKVIIYAVIDQFDGATGTDMFLATAGPVQQEASSDTRTMFVGDAGMLSAFVEGDNFRAEATVVGAEGYDTQAGGHTTVPKLQVDSIKRTS